MADDRLDRPVRVRLTGDGPLRDDLEVLASDLEMADRVSFLGFLQNRADVYREMAAAHVYAAPSRWEGFSVAVPESMAAGTPCLLSDIDVFRELYDGAAAFHGVDDTEALADRLVFLAENPIRRKKLAERGRVLVTSLYTLETTAERYARTYRELLIDGA